VSLLQHYEIAAILLQSGQALNWGAVFSRASTLRVVIPLQRILSTVATLWPAVIAPRTMETLAEQKPSRTEHWVDGRLESVENKETIIGILAWFTTAGVLRRFRYILETLIPSPAYLKKYFGPAPLGLWPLLYLWRVAAFVLNRPKPAQHPQFPGLPR